MNHTQNDEIEIDLKDLLFLLLNRIWVIILAGVVGAAAFFAYTYALVQPIYESQSMIYILTKSTSLTSLADLQVGTQLTNDYVVFVTSRPVVDKVIENLDLNMSYKEFVDNVRVNNPTNTRILEITVSNYDAYMAQMIVNELTDVAVERVAAVMETDPPSIVDYGHVAANPSSPSLVKNSVIGGILFAFLSIVVIVILYLLNDSVHTSEDVEKYLGLNTLGIIPLEEGTSKKKTRGRDKDAKKLKRKGEKS